MPDRILVYRLSLCEVCADVDELRHEVAVTVVHEVAHHFGIDDDTLDGLGWAWAGHRSGVGGLPRHWHVSDVILDELLSGRQVAERRVPGHEVRLGV